MKKSILILTVIFFTAFSGTLLAQGAEIGLKGGVNLANLSGDFANDLDSKIAIHGGLYARFMLNDNFGIQPELLFSRQGAEDSGNGFEFSLRYDYLSIPVMARFKMFGPLFFHAGPQFNFLTSAEAESTISGVTSTQDLKDNTNGLDLSVALGLDVDLPIGLNAGVRYVYGLSNIDDSPSNEEVQNRIFQIYVVKRLFGLGGR